MEILWWLMPPVVVTVLAMLWVTWLGRSNRGQVDRDAAVERLAKALRKDLPGSSGASAVPPRPRDRSTGIAVRPSGSNADRRSA
ncbi:MAG: hypothetical protein L0H93_13495 [Nocardioides sp.]|nr:hypothetical protein [Nocardioides sp.]